MGRYQRPRRPSDEGSENPFAGKVSCLGFCGKDFYSPDRRRVRMCDRCKGKEPDLFHGKAIAKGVGQSTGPVSSSKFPIKNRKKVK